jgi:GntP family gluconate:H+ symporter
VPPTPGPLSAAGNLNISDSIGLVIIIGLVVSIPSLFLSTWFANKFAKNLTLISEDEENIAIQNHKKLPSAWLAFMPILLPILLISLASFAKILHFPETVTTWLSFIGSPLISFLLAIFLSYFLFPEKPSERLLECFKSGINHCGTTLVLVGAGGAFGAVLKETPLKEMMTDWLINNQSSGLLFLLFAFLIAAFFKTAQGSTTSAMVLSSSLLAPILISVGFTQAFELTLLLMAIGSGAMVVSHANDAWFWVVSQFTGISQKDAFKTHTLLTGLQGIASFITVCFLYIIFN